MIMLSDEQQLIVDTPLNEAIQVLATAGSGKTRVLTERIRYILQSTKKDGVIAVTFTSKAAEEMRTRLSDLNDLQERCWIETLYSVARRVLNQYGYSIGLPTNLQILENNQDRKTIFLQALNNQGVDVDAYLNVPEPKRKKRGAILRGYMERFAEVKRDLLSREAIKQNEKYGDDFLKIYDAYQDALLSNQCIDFDDILVYARRILIEQPLSAKIYRAKFKHICVDEAQDLNKAQYEFIKAFCGDVIHSVMMVGDPKQMIYGFNGASHQYLCQYFISDFKPIAYKLDKNYRSAQSIIQLANQLIPNNPFSSVDLALKGLVETRAFASEETEAIWIVQKIQQLLTLANHTDIDGTIVLSKMAVIARNRFIFKVLIKQLEHHTIEYSLTVPEMQSARKKSVLAQVLDDSLRLYLNDKDSTAYQNLHHVLGLSNSPKQMIPLAEIATQVAKKGAEYANLYRLAIEQILLLEKHSPNIKKLCITLRKALEAEKENDALLMAYYELDEFNKSWVTFKRNDLGDSLQAFRNASSMGQLNKQFNSQGVTLGTTHTMKGTEKDIVFLMGMNEGVLPDYRAKTPQTLKEEKNNAFVAITRAKRWLYISYPETRVMPWGDKKQQKVSSFIKNN
jgi:DNA helicase-2/ATP-dependent DNA helicase PcrA